MVYIEVMNRWLRSLSERRERQRRGRRVEAADWPARARAGAAAATFLGALAARRAGAKPRRAARRPRTGHASAHRCCPSRCRPAARVRPQRDGCGACRPGPDRSPPPSRRAPGPAGSGPRPPARMPRRSLQRDRRLLPPQAAGARGAASSGPAAAGAAADLGKAARDAAGRAAAACGGRGRGRPCAGGADRAATALRLVAPASRAGRLAGAGCRGARRAQEPAAREPRLTRAWDAPSTALRRSRAAVRGGRDPRRRAAERAGHDARQPAARGRAARLQGRRAQAGASMPDARCRRRSCWSAAGRARAGWCAERVGDHLVLHDPAAGTSAAVQVDTVVDLARRVVLLKPLAEAAASAAPVARARSCSGCARCCGSSASPRW